MDKYIKVKISEDGKTCKEVNIISDIEPNEYDYRIGNPFGWADNYKVAFYNWQQAESKLKTFEITHHYTDEDGFETWTNGRLSTIPKPSSIQSAKILENGKVTILRNSEGKYNDL